MNFMFEWQTQYLTSERSSLVRYCVCHENIKFISSSQRAMFFLFYGDKISEIAHFYSLLVASVEKNSLKTLKSYKVFFFVFSLSKLSENSFTCSSFSKTNLLATAIILNNTEATTHSVHSTK